MALGLGALLRIVKDHNRLCDPGMRPKHGPLGVLAYRRGGRSWSSGHLPPSNPDALNIIIVLDQLNQITHAIKIFFSVKLNIAIARTAAIAFRVILNGLIRLPAPDILVITQKPFFPLFDIAIVMPTGQAAFMNNDREQLEFLRR